RAGAPRRAPVWYEPAPPEVRRAEVSVVIPTLGRYPYLPAALESLRAQTVRPREVVVVDQNPAEERRPEVYEGWDDLGLRVVWQDERGQSLARNTALAAVSHPYVFFFDDDSVAAPDLVERHLRVVLAGRFDVSTGVSYPPPPTDYRLPEGFAHPRVAQTLDTGNCLMPTALARAMGGLDRNYDFGPGTDADLGTRLYLAGRRIAHTPDAVRVHFKAPMGGLRVHGAHKTNTDAALLAPFPPVTQSYFGLRYLSPRQQRERMLLAFVTSKLARPARRGRPAARAAALLRVALWGLLLPLKWRRSRSRARALLRAGVRLAEFPPAPGEAS
ncbi:MAG TPA: glycosyltransferase family 2 protein, partial [Longimicrobium sp.]|nr:glycosyltransferase family 2 protein [Longimicrobium sp.]